MHNAVNVKRILGLDILRAIAILLVVFGHGEYLLKNTFLEGFPYINMLDGVDLFFVLSGFLIGGILLECINCKEKFYLKDLYMFWKRRWYRTLPNYYLFLLINFVVVNFGIVYTRADVQHFNWKFLFFSQNLLHPFQNFFWESWSLSVEEWFYILSPLSLFILLRFINSKFSFLLVTCFMIVFPFLYRLHLLNLTANDFVYDIMFRKMVSTRLDSIAFGLLAAWIFFYYYKYWLKYKMITFIAAMILMTFLINFPAGMNTMYKQLFYFSLSSISVMLLLPFFQSIKYSKGKIADSITFISKISYSMYLVNFLVEQIIEDNFVTTGSLATVIKYLFYWILVIVISAILYKYFEKPVMMLRDKKFYFKWLNIPKLIRLI